MNVEENGTQVDKGCAGDEVNESLVATLPREDDCLVPTARTRMNMASTRPSLSESAAAFKRTPPTQTGDRE